MHTHPLVLSSTQSSGSCVSRKAVWRGVEEGWSPPKEADLTECSYRRSTLKGDLVTEGTPSVPS